MNNWKSKRNWDFNFLINTWWWIVLRNTMFLTITNICHAIIILVFLAEFNLNIIVWEKSNLPFLDAVWYCCIFINTICWWYITDLIRIFDIRFYKICSIPTFNSIIIKLFHCCYCCKKNKQSNGIFIIYSIISIIIRS